MEMTSADTRADFRLRQVVKRYISPDRVVIIWTTDGQPIEYMNKLTNVGFHEKGYVICRPPRTPVEAISPAATVLQVCHRISPYQSNHAAHRASLRANVDNVAQFVFSSLDLELKANQERIENLLLDETDNP